MAEHLQQVQLPPTHMIWLWVEVLRPRWAGRLGLTVISFSSREDGNEIRKNSTLQAVSKSSIACCLDSGSWGHSNPDDQPAVGRQHSESQRSQVRRKTFPGSAPWSGNTALLPLRVGSPPGALWHLWLREQVSGKVLFTPNPGSFFPSTLSFTLRVTYPW